jgi:hypothetical protein
MSRSKPVRCDACGQTWDRHPALEVECPQCHAKPGRNCRRPGEYNLSDPHVAREQLAVDSGVLPLCSEGPTMRARRAEVHLEMQGVA